MNKLFGNNWSINSRLLLFFLFFGITITTSHFLTRSSFEVLEKYQIILNKANHNSDIVEQMVIHTNQILANRSQAKSLLADDLAEYQLNLDILKNGGIETLDGKNVELPTCDPSLLPRLQEIENIWNQYRTKAEYVIAQETFSNITSAEGKKILDASVQSSANFIEQNQANLISLQKQFVNIYTDISQKKKAQANAWLWGLWIGNILLIITGYFIIQALLIRPLSQIKGVAKEIGEGNLNHKIHYQAQNEVGLVATAINDMVDKIRHATEFIKSIEQGDLTVSYSGLNGTSLDKDTLAGALINMRERMKSVASEEEERNWATRGQAVFGEILQTFNDETETLSYEIISNLVKYLDANQGGIFIVNDENKEKVYLDLIASYAFNRRRYLERKIASGEGLVGQSFKDADTIYITDIPENYVDITSGLGGAQPKSVLVIPLKLSDRVYGVMELASFYEFKDYQIKFLEKLSENIASNLYAARANEQTKKLLNESQKTADQMRQQEQEMRRNMQVLEATQSEMQRNQEALAVQSFALKSTLITVELGIDGKILTVNDLFLQAIHYSSEELIGKDYTMLVPENQTDTSNYDRLWRDLKAGIPRSGEYKRIDKHGKEIWLRATYSPIKDKNGIPYKVLKLAFDITEDKKLRLDFKEQLDSFRRSSAIVEFDIQGKIIEANENFLELMEYSREEIIGQNHLLIVPEDERESKQYLALWHKLRQGSYHIGEVKRITKSGNIVWFQGSFNPILDLNGKPYKIIEVIIDITDRKNAEARMFNTQIELQAKEANLVALINNTDDAIYTINPNYRITLLNESTRKLYEKIGTSVRVSSNVLESLPKNYYYIWKAYYDRALSGDKFSIEQAIFSEETTQKLYLSVYFNPIINDYQEVAGVAIFARDVSARKQREMDIAEFTKKQASRTARIIENQKQNFTFATQQYETERLRLQTLANSLQKSLTESQAKLNFLSKIEDMALCINQDYLVVEMNAPAKQLFYEWRFYLQPHYLLTDIFPQAKFDAWKAYLDRAFDGEKFTIGQVFAHRPSRQGRVFAISFLPIKNDLQVVTHIMISAKEITAIMHKQQTRSLERRKRWLLNQKRSLKIFQDILPRKGQESIVKPIEVAQNQLVKKVKHAKLDDVADELHILLDAGHCLLAYNQKTWDFFHQWYFYLQPQYYFPDTFPMLTYDKWFSHIEKAMTGESFTVREIFINRRLRKIYVIEIQLIPEFYESGNLKNILIKAKDVSEFVNPRQVL